MGQKSKQKPTDVIERHIAPWDFNIPTHRELEFMREQTGLSQEQFAKLTGYSRSYVWDVESGRKSPGLNYITKALIVCYHYWPKDELEA